MKKTYICALALVSTASSTALFAQSFIGNATPLLGETGIFAYWNFNALSIATASAPGSGGVPTSIAADFGSGSSLSLTGWTGLVDDFAGSTINVQSGNLAEESLSLASNAGNGSYIELSFSMANLQDLVINFATRGTNSGYDSSVWSYSTDGTTFTAFGASTATRSGTFAAASPGLAMSFLNNSSTAFLRYTLSNASSLTGNNRIDNLTLTATVIPEPSTYAALLGLVAISAVALRRRPRA